MLISREIDVSSRWKHGYSRLAEHISKILPNSEKKTILELGCGSGQLTLPLAANTKSKIVAIDTSEHDTGLLKKRIVDTGFEDRVSVQVIDASNLNYKMEEFDGVLSNFFFGWLDEKRAREITSRIREMLAVGGLMVHSDFLPVAGTPAQKIAISQGMPENNVDPSLKWWTPEEVCELLEDEGFRDMAVSYFDWNIRFNYPYAVQQLMRWGAKHEFIRANEEQIKIHGLELPKSFIVTSRR